MRFHLEMAVVHGYRGHFHPDTMVGRIFASLTHDAIYFNNAWNPRIV